jgi:hypothetical protein
MAARQDPHTGQDATHREDTSVQGLVAADRWEVQSGGLKVRPPHQELSDDRLSVMTSFQTRPGLRPGPKR